MTTKQLALPIDGLRSGLLGSLPMDASYMESIKKRASKISEVCAVKPGATHKKEQAKKS